jgi:hypothetical protein
MTNELVKTTSFETTICDIENTRKMCDMLMKTPHYAKMGQDGIFAIVTKSNALGVNPVDALNGGLYYVQGKVGMSSEMMASLIRQQGHSITKDAKSTNDICILHGKRSDNQDTWTVTFSMDDARRAGLAKNMYEKYPSIMLYNRCMSMLARQLFPDIIKGAGYTMDELREIAKIETIPAQVETVVETISTLQFEELKNLLMQCPAEYQQQVAESLLKLPNPVHRLNDLPAGLFERVKLAAIKNKSKETLSMSDMVIEEDSKVA